MCNGFGSFKMYKMCVSNLNIKKTDVTFTDSKVAQMPQIY